MVTSQDKVVLDYIFKILLEQDNWKKAIPEVLNCIYLI